MKIFAILSVSALAQIPDDPTAVVEEVYSACVATGRQAAQCDADVSFSIV